MIGLIELRLLAIGGLLVVAVVATLAGAGLGVLVQAARRVYAGFAPGRPAAARMASTMK